MTFTMIDRARYGEEYDENRANYLTTMNGKQNELSHSHSASVILAVSTLLQNPYMTNSQRRAHSQSLCHIEGREPTEINGDAPGHQPH